MKRNLLYSVIVGHGDTMSTLAEAMGLPLSALSNRMHGKVEFRQNEILFIKRRYHLTAEETERIFFAEIVSEKDTTEAC